MSAEPEADFVVDFEEHGVDYLAEHLLGERPFVLAEIVDASEERVEVSITVGGGASDRLAVASFFEGLAEFLRAEVTS